MTMIEYRNIVYLAEDARLSEEEREQVDRILSLWKYAPLPEGTQETIGRLRARIARGEKP